ncbi:hypothetical protein ECC02_005056 [Trypanosoma cruzi]|uniref:Uncharacterized protein n=1 Tax=Trypanosoma cruzi TaxID=5693 RepID=A0A7J6Y6J5_TRYCR|nr:hypothetical protein ECC02_005056 [Trypanosoma cruzi]
MRIACVWEKIGPKRWQCTYTQIAVSPRISSETVRLALLEDMVLVDTALWHYDCLKRNKRSTGQKNALRLRLIETTRGDRHNFKQRDPCRKLECKVVYVCLPCPHATFRTLLHNRKLLIIGVHRQRKCAARETTKDRKSRILKLRLRHHAKIRRDKSPLSFNKRRLVVNETRVTVAAKLADGSSSLGMYVVVRAKDHTALKEGHLFQLLPVLKKQQQQNPLPHLGRVDDGEG